MKNDELLHKWVNDELNAEELDTFKGRSEYKSLVDLYKKTDQFKTTGFDEDKMLANILKQDKKTAKIASLPRRRFLTTWMKYAAAAAILLVTTLFFWPADNLIEYATAKGEQIRGQLPNGSTFVLNAASTLAYNPDIWDTERSLQLSGEAFFEVEKGKPFKVNTSNGVVKVLGTKFNVWSRKQGLEVKCHTGKVAVSAPDNSTQVITENESIKIIKGKLLKKQTITAPAKPSWTTGLSKFRNVPLIIVLEELERQFNVDIDARKIDTTEIISCNFEHTQLELALKTSLASLDLQYEIQNGNRVILSDK